MADLTEGEEAAFPTRPMTTDIEAIIEIEAPPEAVWRIMTDTAMAWRWLGAFGFAPVVGQRFVLQPSPRRREARDFEGVIPCRLEVLDPNRRLRFSWSYPGRPPTEVTLALTPLTGGSHVRLTHTGWEAFEDDMQADDLEMALAALGASWADDVLPALKALAESGGSSAL